MDHTEWSASLLIQLKAHVLLRSYKETIGPNQNRIWIQTFKVNLLRLEPPKVRTKLVSFPESLQFSLQVLHLYNGRLSLKE